MVSSNPHFATFLLMSSFAGHYRGYCQERVSLARQLSAKIRATGPITVADYMKEVLVNPSSGYYTQHESIGAGGDFVTSPELSQLFGEVSVLWLWPTELQLFVVVVQMLAVWLLNEWHKVGSPKPMQLIELGPGKGTLMEDILRVSWARTSTIWYQWYWLSVLFQVFKHLGHLDGVSVHLVELSPRLQDLQAKRLCSEVTLGSASETCGMTHAGCPIYWHHGISEVPDGAFACVLAHEFFDALPVHKLQVSRHLHLMFHLPRESN